MPEGDTILSAANRMRPVLVGVVPEEIIAPQRRHERDRWPQRLAGRAVRAIDTHGKNLLIRFEGGLAVYSHLRMTGMWGVYERGARWRRSPRRAWLILRTPAHEVVQFDGPVLELVTDLRTRSDPRLRLLGPDLLAPDFDPQLALRRLRQDDPTRPIGDALLDQRTVAGIGNIWRAEACWHAAIDPWRASGEVADEAVLSTLAIARERMLASAGGGGHPRGLEVYERTGRPCGRCGTPIASRGQGDDNRILYWCPGCQR